MEKSFGCIFYLKRKGNDLSKEIDIYLRITVDSDPVELSTKRKCFKENWNVKAGRAEGKTDYAKSINTYLDTLQQKVFEAKRRLIEVDEEVTSAKIKHLMLGGKVNKEKYMLMEQFKIHNEQIQALIGRDYAKGTLDRYETAYRHTLQFLQDKYKVSDIDIEKLNYDFITNYEFWLKTVRKCDHNTTMKYLANFKKIVIRCVKSGKLARDPFVGFVMSKKEVEREVLNDDQLRRIAQENFSAERMAIVRDIFLFCCFTGLAYADIKKLKQTEIIKGNDGGLWIIAKRQKTNVTSRIPLLPAALEIIERYKNHPQCTLKGMVLPVLSNQKMNSYLKPIADRCGIHFCLTFHIARHTFATTVTLSNGIPIETVSKMLGHRNLKTTQHYAKILDKKISDDMKKLKDYRF
jgi:site-specific recombinase XerD